jgi:PKD repeat protein
MMVVIGALLALPAQAAAGPPGHFRGIVTAGTSAGRSLAQSRVSRGASRTSGSNNLQYWGGPVMHSDANYSVYWEPGSYITPSSYKNVIDGYFTNVGAASGSSGSDYSVATQYYDGSGNIAYAASFGGRTLDADSYPASGCPSTGGVPCLTDAQIEAELQTVIGNNLPTSLNQIYYVFTPPNVATCFDSSGRDCSSGGANFDYCAYHSSFNIGSSTVLYAVMPYAGVSGCNSGESPNGSPADSTVNVTSHENIEAITDPLGSAWFDSSGNEIGDKCAWNFGSALGGGSGSLYNETIASNNYWLQQEWSNASSSCVQRMAASSHPVASFTFSPTSPATGQSVSFNGSGSTDSGATITQYSWNFGDGGTGTGVSTTHSYANAGSYSVTLKITDSAGQTSTVSHTVTVLKPGPVAAFTWSPSAPVHGQPVGFNGSGSTDATAAITRYAWSFGDGQSTSGSSATVSHTYTKTGRYNVTLTVTDSAGFSSQVTHTVRVS